MAKITLINPPRLFLDGGTAMSQCLGLGYIAAYLRERGHAIQLLDALGLGFDVVEADAVKPGVFRYGLGINSIIGQIEPSSEWIGISGSFFSSKRPVFELAAALKRKWPDKKIILGGNLGSGLPAVCLENPDIDYIVVGEGEVPLAELLEGRDPRYVRGLYSRANFSVSCVNRAEQIADLDLIPYPARDLLPFEKYLTVSQRLRTGTRAVSIITSRGCPFDCSFCSVHPTFGHKWRSRTVENIVGEINHVVTRYGCNFLEFEDDNLTLQKDRALELFERMEKLGIKWSAPNGLMIGKLDDDLLKKIKSSGCEFFFLPVESGDPDVLKLMNKQVDLDHAANIARAAVRLKLRVAAAIIIGHPGETRESFMKTMAYCDRLHKAGIREFAFLMLNTYPGTKVFADYADAPAVARLGNCDFLGHGDVTLETKDFDARELKWRMEYAQKRFTPWLVSTYQRHHKMVTRFLGRRVIGLFKGGSHR